MLKQTHKYCSLCSEIDMSEVCYVDVEAKYYVRPRRDPNVMCESVYMAMKYEEIREDVQSLYNKNKSKIKNAEAIPVYLTQIL